MRSAALALTCITTALTAASCVPGDPVDLDRNPWTPPPKEVVDTTSHSVVTGRLWVIPNPILFRPDEYEVRIEIWTIGTAGTDIQDIRFFEEGSPEASIFHSSGGESGAFSAYAGLGGTAPPLPLDLGFRTDCGGGPGMGLHLDRAWDSTELTGGTFIVETDDPTSPTIEVPIGFDMTGTHTLERDPGVWDIFIDVRPNPVRFRAGVPEMKELCVGVQNAEWGITLDAVTIHGEGLSLVAPVDLSAPGGFSVEYAPASGSDVNGALVVDFTDNWGDEETLVVPIIVR